LVPPSVVWGIGVGLLIAAIDTVALVLMSTPWATQWPIGDIDFMANIVLYSLIGFRVGRMTGVIRDAAESGVLAAVIVALLGIAATLALRPSTESINSTNTVIALFAQNIAIGGVLAIVAGWIGSRAHHDRPAPRR
jgi:hypothetical protein